MIIKRDGRKVVFNAEKIISALMRAFSATVQTGNLPDTGEPDFARFVLDKVLCCADIEQCKDIEVDVPVETIQDIIERKLMSSRYKDVAKSYILYRDERSRIRQSKSKLMRMVGEKLMAQSLENQNANVDEISFGGRMGEARNLVSKEYALEHCMSEMARNNHLQNRIYIHDLDSYAVGLHNCLFLPFDYLLRNGFSMRQTDVRPARSVNTAFQLVAVLFQLQSLNQYGGVGATKIDHDMVPYVRLSYLKHLISVTAFDNDRSEDEVKAELYKEIIMRSGKEGADIEDLIYDLKFDFMQVIDDIYSVPYRQQMEVNFRSKCLKAAKSALHKEVYQAAEGLFHNLNTLQSRSGNQLPFTSINFGTCTLPEGQLISEALLKTLNRGIGKFFRTSIFPCTVFQWMRGVNNRSGTPNYYLYRLALETTAKRLYPNYANVNCSINAGFDVDDPSTYMSTMGCRTQIGYDCNGMGLKKDGRGNLSPVTIILPTIAMEAVDIVGQYSEEIFNKFLRLLDKTIDEARDMLLERYKLICSQPAESGKFMYENNVMAGYIPEEGTVSALKHGTLAIGQIGLAETLQILMGVDHTDLRGMEAAKKIEDLFKRKCAQFKKDYSLNFGVYYTPAENLCFTSMKKFKERYGVILNVSDKEFFTNSIHVPVWKEISPFDKIDIESQLIGFSNAGCITYVELKDTVSKNVDALEELVNYAMEHDIPYFAVNVPVDLCMDCGHQGTFNGVCSMCGSGNIQQLRRVTGYLTGDYKSAFNKGKVQETELRVKHADVMGELPSEAFEVESNSKES